MQNRRGLLFLGLALLLGVVAAGVAQRWMTSHALKAPDAVETGKVIVARVDLSIASSLTERQLDAVEWPKAHVPNGAFFDTQVDITERLQTAEPLVDVLDFKNSH